MFINNINPDLLTIGPFAIRPYGLVYALGFLAATFFLRRAAREGRIRNLNEEQATDLMVWTMVGLVIGARIAHLFFQLDYYAAHPLEIFMFWKGGMAFIGGLIGAFLASYLYCRKKKVDVFAVADPLSVVATATLGFGKIANFMNSELVGKVTNLPWGVNFSHERDAAGNLVYRHPVQLYEAALMFIDFGILYFLNRKNHKKGFVFWNFVWLYGVSRFIGEAIRQPIDILILGLTPMQYVSIGMVILSVIMLNRGNAAGKKTIAKEGKKK